ncbi:MAG: hypothetical protein ACM3VT_20120 [Solirubrobacterales bacterium]
MDDRQVYPRTLGRSVCETLPGDHFRSHGFYMVDSQEHELLLAEGHYRCPHCRRADAAEAGSPELCKR